MKRSILFLIGAIWNFLFAISGLALTKFTAELILVPAHEQAFAMLWMFCGLVAAFGIGYFLAWRNPVAFRGVIWLGIIGKVIVFFQLIVLYTMGIATLLFLFAGIGDLVFAGLFYLYLKNNPAPSTANIGGAGS